MKTTLALDASVRTMDENGHLRVAKTCISKADVNPYFGREIPGYEALGLDADKIYNLLRDPAELEKAADSFKGKQLLIKHIPVDSSNPEKEYTVGAIGSDIAFDGDRLYSDLTIWDDQAISLIESGKMKELSAGYLYTPDMTPGEYNGIPYDGVMRNILGNHVALVERGRIGKDAVICDELPLPLRKPPTMKTKLKAGALQKITARFALDENTTEELIEEVAENIEHKPVFDEAKLRELAGDNYEEIVKLIGGEAGQAEDEDDDPKAESERKELEETDRDDRDAKRDDDKPAMDADAIAATVEARINAKYAARDAVEQIVGRIALDGFSDASAIYAYALNKKGIATDGINEAGLKALVATIRDNKPAPAPVAMDSAPSDLTKRFKKGI